MATYPAGLLLGTLTLDVNDLIADRAGGSFDADDLPDAADVTMTVEARPSVDMIRPGGTGRIYRMPVDFSWSGTNLLLAADGTGGWQIPSTDNPTPKAGLGWTWQVRVTVSGQGVQSVYTTDALTLTDGEVKDLSPLLELGVRSYSLSATVLTLGGGGAVASVAGKTGTVTLTSADLTDSTATGRSVVTAATAAAARTAIGAGTSSLALGTTAGTAKAGDYAPTRADISDATANGRTLMAAPALPALDVWQASDGTWPARPTWTGRVNWVGYPALTSTPTGMATGDTYMQRA